MTWGQPIHNTVQHDINLQATLSAASALSGDNPQPHHPITCTGTLSLYEDGRFACEHAEVPPGDERTGYALDHSIALLLIELAVARFGSPGHIKQSPIVLRPRAS